MLNKLMLSSRTVQSGYVAATGLLLEGLGRALDKYNLVADATGDMLRYSGQGLFAMAVPLALIGIRKHIGEAPGFVHAGLAAGLGLFSEMAARACLNYDILSSTTAEVLRLGGQGLTAAAVPLVMLALRRAIGGEDKPAAVVPAEPATQDKPPA